ncbi:MAG: CapA family protein, partial [Coriobacteriales bacterium]|nr:CapA family protein [Coriobacteriales bacterium]
TTLFRSAAQDAVPDMRHKTVSFIAVGDNLIHSSIYKSHATGDGGYSFDDMYDSVAATVQEADVAYLNQETVCGGTELGLADYPCFNSPFEVLDAVQAAGFDWINTASNHSFDVGEAGILSQLAHLDTLPGLTETGTHRSWDDAQQPTVIEANGVSIGLLSYTYGLNGFVLPEGGEYLVDLIDTPRIAQDVERLVQLSDVQIVSMHWGDEYSHVPSDEQVELAYFLSDLGVDIVIGAHPHVIQPTTMITGGQGNQTLVIYSLGNFISAQDEPERMLGEMASWTVRLDSADGSLSFEDIEIRPTVTQILPDWHGYKAYLLRDYTDDLAKEHMLVSKGLSRDYLVTLALDVFGDEFPVAY